MLMSKKYFITLLFIGYIYIGFSQQKKYKNFDVNWEQSTSKHNIAYQCECYVLETGALDGPFKCYIAETDTLIKSYNFVNNILNGEILEYYRNGNLKLEAFYDKGIPIKTWKEWNETGELVVDKMFSDEGKYLGNKNEKQPSEYEKMYFGSKKFEAPIFTTTCIVKNLETLQYSCSDTAMLAYYNTPPLPPNYFNNIKFSGKQFQVKLKYQLSELGKVDTVIIIETSGDAFLDDLAETHILNMMPFEAAKEYGNPIKYWIEAILNFKF